MGVLDLLPHKLRVIYGCPKFPISKFPQFMGVLNFHPVQFMGVPNFQFMGVLNFLVGAYDG